MAVPRVVDAATGRGAARAEREPFTGGPGHRFQPGWLAPGWASEWPNAEVSGTPSLVRHMFRISSICIGIKAVFTQASSRLITSSQDGIAKARDGESGQELFTLAGSGSGDGAGCRPRLRSFAWLSVARPATASRDGYRPGAGYLATPGAVSCWSCPDLATQFSPDGLHLITGGLHSTASYYQTREFSRGALDTVIYSSTASLPAPVVGGDFSPDGTRVAMLASDASFTEFDMIQGTQVISFPIDKESEMSFALNPAWTWLATVVSDTIQIWDATNGQKLLDLPEYPPRSYRV